MKAFQNKRSFRKTCILLVLLLVTLVTMSACIGKGQEDKTPTNGVTDGDNGEAGPILDEDDKDEQKITGPSLDEIKERGYITMGLDDAFAPMGFRDKDSNLVGFDVDLAKAVFEKAGIELKLQPDRLEHEGNRTQYR